jgi:hypothetical protein
MAYPQYTVQELYNDIPIIECLVMLNEASYQDQLSRYSLMPYMQIATAQVEKKNQGKVKSAWNKLKPKHMLHYDAPKDEEVKEELEGLEKFIGKQKIDN